MSEHDGTEATTKRRRGRQTNTTNQENGKHASAVQRPTNDDKEAWNAYWKEQGQPWRTEPEIDAERRKYLAERRGITPDIKQGIYPFKDIKLTRADVEWLLATHENGRGPIDWSDQRQHQREGLDLRGADLRQANLSGLPLTRMRGGLTSEEWYEAADELRSDMATIEERWSAAGVLLQKANLRRAQLQEAYFCSAHLEGSDLRKAHLEGAFSESAHLEGAILGEAYLERTYLHLASLKKADLKNAHLEKANLWESYLQHADLERAHLEGADLTKAHLEGANLTKAHLEGANLTSAYLEGVRLSAAFFNGSTQLNEITFGKKKFSIAFLADVHWGDVNISVFDWSVISILAQQPKRYDLLDTHMRAMRASRQLAVVLRNQGLNEDAARFAYRAQLIQRRVFWYERKFGQYLFSLFLYLLSGYGYKPIRSFITYVIVISVFALIYLLLGIHLVWNEAIVISMTAFHGRGFFPDQFHPGDPQAWVAAIEAFVGLLIEVTFIATLTQRLFGK